MVLSGVCNSVTMSDMIDVRPNNRISLTSAAGTISQTKCINTAIESVTFTTTSATGAHVSNLPTGVTYQWTVGASVGQDSVLTISGTPTVAGTYTYTIYLDGGCGTITSTGVMDIIPDMTIALTSNNDGQGVCINTPLTQVKYKLTRATAATTVAGLPAGVVGTWTTTTNNNVTDTVYIISGTPTVSGIFNYTITLGGGCGTVSKTGTLFVKENTITLASAAGTASQTLCINTAITPIKYNTTVATGAAIFDFPAGITGAWVDSVYTITGKPTVAGTFSYTVSTTGGCASKTAYGIVDVKPNNTINLSSDSATLKQAICINTPLTNIVYKTTGAVGAHADGLPAGITGTWSITTTNNSTDSVFVISGTPTVAGTYTYTILLEGGCGVITSTASIYVKINTIKLVSAAGTDAQVKCINTDIDKIVYKTSIATNAVVAGLPAGLYGLWDTLTTNNKLDSLFTISGSANEAGTFTYTITLVGGCDQTPTTISGTIKIDPASDPGVISFTDIGSPICNQGAKPTISLNYNVGDSIIWQKSLLPNGPYTNIANMHGKQLKDSIANIAADTSIVTTYYRVGVKSGVCAIKYSSNLAVEVRPTPKVLSIKGDTVCGPGPLTVKATTNIGTPYWFYNTTTDSVLGVGTTFVTPPIDSSGNLYVAGFYNGCYSLTRTPVYSLVKYIPVISAVVNGENCGPGKVKLGATATKGIVNWYAAPTGGTRLDTGAIFTTPVLDVSTTYYVDATLDGCTTKDRRFVNAVINEVPVATRLTGNPSNICVGKGLYLENNVTGGLPPYQFEYVIDSSFVTTTTYGKIIGARPGLASIVYKVKDAKGCYSAVTDTFKVKVAAAVEPKIFFQEAYFNEATIIKTKVDSGYTVYNWYPALDLSFYDNVEPTFKGTTDHLYYLRRTDTLTQCDVVDTYNITVTKDHILNLPNAFTPNGDGLNDKMMIFKNVGVLEFHYLKIFNRYGQLVYQTTNITEGWDGKVGGQLQQMDSYFWTAEYVTKENKVVQVNGSFLLLN
jgi:gliding motility-associated-like protein